MLPLFNHHFSNGKLQDNWFQLLYDLCLASLIYNLSTFNFHYICFYLLYHQLWFSQALLSSRYAMHPFIDSIIQLIQFMFISIAAMLNIDSDPEYILLLTIGFIVGKLSIIIPYFIVICFYPKEHLRIMLPFAIAVAFEITLWIISYFHGYHLIYWTIGTVLEKLACIFALASDLPTSYSYFNDRIGVFTVSLLGLALFTLTTGYNLETVFSINLMLRLLLYTILTISFWHNYFYCSRYDDIENVFALKLAWIFTQLLLHFSMSFYGTSIYYSVASISGILIFTSIANSLDINPDKRLKLIARIIVAIISISLGVTVENELILLSIITTLFVCLMGIEHLLFMRVGR